MTVSSIEQVPVSYGKVLAHLGLKPDDPRSQAVVLVCQRYSLDPVLKHVLLVEGQVYVTRDGLLHIAHSSGQLDGMEVEEAHLSDDGTEWLSRASVYRKDMARPFSLSGRYPKGKKNAKEMAEKVAVARTLRHAFDVAIATDDERQAETSEPQRPRVTAADIVRPKPAPPALDPAPGEHVDVATGEVHDALPVEDPPAEPLWPATPEVQP